MARVGSNDPERSDSSTAVELWLTTETNRDGDLLVHPAVLEVAKANWPWVRALVARQLNDVPQAATMCEEVAIEVSRQLRRDSEVGRNLGSYFRTAMIHRVAYESARSGKIVYLGATYDLEAACCPSSPDWTTSLQNQMAVAALAQFMTPDVRVILHYLEARYTWKELAARIGLSDRQALARFYYGVKRAHERLLDQQARRAQAERDESDASE